MTLPQPAARSFAQGMHLQACVLMMLLPQHGGMQMGEQPAHRGGRRCLAPGCLRRKAYGFPRGSDNPPAACRPQFCAQHKAPGHVNLMTRLCATAGCARAASFGPVDPADSAERGGKLWRCAAHRAADDVDYRSRSKTCAFKACRRQGSFASARGGLLCKAHADPGSDGDRKNRRCRQAGCKKRASFGTCAPEWCSQHRGPNDDNKRISICAQAGCTNEATYGRLRDAKWTGQEGVSGQPGIEEEPCMWAKDVATENRSYSGARRKVVEPLLCAAHARSGGNSTRKSPSNNRVGADAASSCFSRGGRDVLVSRLAYGAAKRRKAKLAESRRLLDALVDAFRRAGAAFPASPHVGGDVPVELSSDLVASAERVLHHDGRSQQEALVLHMLRVGVLQTGAPCCMYSFVHRVGGWCRGGRGESMCVHALHSPSCSHPH